MYDSVNSLVFDIGSHNIRAGYGGSDLPTIIPTAYADASSAHYLLNPFYVGNEAVHLEKSLSVERPVEDGHVKDFEQLTAIIENYITYERLDSSEHYSLILEPLELSKTARESFAEIFFETLQFPALCLRPIHGLSVYSSPKLSGLVVDLGEWSSRVVPVYEGSVLRYAATRVKVGGKHVTERFWKALKKADPSATATLTTFELENAKKEVCRVSLSYDPHLDRFLEGDSRPLCYELPDGNTVTIGEDRLRSAEILFNPNSFGFDCLGIIDAIVSSLEKVPSTIRDIVKRNIILCGGSSMLNELPARLSIELENFYGEKDFKFYVASERADMGWIGGSLFTATPEFIFSSVHQSEYEESGKSIVSSKHII